MARLNDIEIRESEISYSNKRGWFFHPTGHHVRALLLHFLPSAFVLDGSSKFSVVFGEKPAHVPRYGQMLGVSVYYVEHFDMVEYMARPRAEQQEIVLAEISKAMLEVSRTSGADVTPIGLAAAAVRASAFHCDIAVNKLSRSSKDRKLRVDVVRRLDPALGEAWEAVISNGTGAVLGVAQIKEPGCLDRTSHFSKSQWRGDIFQILYGRLNEVQYELDVGKYRQAVSG